MKKKKYILAGIIGCVMCCILLQSGNVSAKEEDMEMSSLNITDGEMEYGTLYGAPYSETDDSKWLTLKLGGRGLRIVNEEGIDVVVVDQFGGVYINGQKCNPEQEEEKAGVSSDFSYGFMYFMIVVSLGLGGYNFLTRKKK